MDFKTKLPDTLIHTLSMHKGQVTSVRFNVNANYCCSAGSDKTLRLWNAVKGKHIFTFTGGHLSEVLGVDLFVHY